MPLLNALDPNANLSPGDGYADTSGSGGSSIDIGSLLKSLLGPTQEQQRAQDQSSGMNPQIVPATQSDLLNSMQFSNGSGAPQGFGAPSAQAPATQPPILSDPNAAAASVPAPQAPQGPANTPIAPATGAPDVSVNADGSASDGQGAAPSNVASDPSQGGGLMSSLIGSAQDAASDPNKAQSLLQTLGQTAQDIGHKLTSLSPNASQALIASGLTILANNNGKQNLAQLIGDGGIAGINNYQTNVQNQAANSIARQKLYQEALNQQAVNQVAKQNANTESFKAANTPTTVAPGYGTTTPAAQASGQGVTGGAPAIAKYVDVPDGKGNVMQQGVDISGNPVGPTLPKTLINTGELTAPQQATINTQTEQAATSAAALAKTRNFISMTSPTINNPDGTTSPNPSYVPISGGVTATVGNALNQLTGGQTQSQLLRSEIETNVRQAQLANLKAGIGGRLSNIDVQLLQKGMPPNNANGATLQSYLTAYSHLQEVQASQDQAKAAYLQANRGDAGPLHPNASLNFNGQNFGPGTTLQQIVSGVTPSGATAPGVAAAPAQGSAPAASGVAQPAANNGTSPAQALAGVQAQARNGNAAAQAALKQRGYTW